MRNRVANILAPSDAVGHAKPVIERWGGGFKLGNLLRRYRFDALERWHAVLKHDPSREDARMYSRLVISKREAAAHSSPVEPSAPAPNPGNEIEL